MTSFGKIYCGSWEAVLEPDSIITNKGSRNLVFFFVRNRYNVCLEKSSDQLIVNRGKESVCNVAIS